MADDARSSPLRIRPAEPRDIGAIAQIHHESYNSSAEGLLPAATLALKTVDFRREQWRARLATVPRSGASVLVAESGAEVLGFIHVSASSTGAEVGEVHKLFVALDHKGRGVGAALLDAGTAALQDSGFARAVLWSLTDNRRAASFYRAHGWRPTGATGQVSIDQTTATLPVTEYARAL